MGSLKPGAKYIYERTDGVTYAREFGSDPSTRQAIGWRHDPTDPNYDSRTRTGKPLYEQIQENKMWGEIHRMAETNPTLQKALDRVIIIYKLSKDKL